jgi:hypothetical protein
MTNFRPNGTKKSQPAVLLKGTVGRESFHEKVMDQLASFSSMIIIGEMGVGKTHLVRRILFPWFDGKSPYWAGPVSAKLKRPPNFRYYHYDFERIPRVPDIFQMYRDLLENSQNAVWVEEVRGSKTGTAGAVKIDTVLHRLPLLIDEILKKDDLDGFYLTIDDFSPMTMRLADNQGINMLNVLSHSARIVVTCLQPLPDLWNHMPFVQRANVVEIPALSPQDALSFFHLADKEFHANVRHDCREEYRHLATAERRTPAEILGFVRQAYEWSNRHPGLFIRSMNLREIDQVSAKKVEYADGKPILFVSFILFLCFLFGLRGADLNLPLMFNYAIIILVLKYSDLLQRREGP